MPGNEPKIFRTYDIDDMNFSWVAAELYTMNNWKQEQYGDPVIRVAGDRRLVHQAILNGINAWAKEQQGRVYRDRARLVNEPPIQRWLWTEKRGSPIGSYLVPVYVSWVDLMKEIDREKTEPFEVDYTFINRIAHAPQPSDWLEDVVMEAQGMIKDRQREIDDLKHDLFHKVIHKWGGYTWLLPENEA